MSKCWCSNMAKKFYQPINEELAKTQKVTNKQRVSMQKHYKKLYKILDKSQTVKPEDAYKLSDKLTKLEYKLQKSWNFPQDPNFHTYQVYLSGCTCPKLDNAERAGQAKIITEGCKYHDRISTKGKGSIPDPVKYRGMMYGLNEPYNTICAKSDKSLKVNLREDDQRVIVYVDGFADFIQISHGSVTVHGVDSMRTIKLKGDRCKD